MTLDSSSVCSDDDIPLNVVGASLYMHPDSVNLKTHNPEHCEFCEVVSRNKYEALVHNAKHIIIPLLKQNVHQCPLCLYYFTSQYKLKHHTRNKHKNDLNKSNNKPNILENKKTEELAKSEENEITISVYESDSDDDLPLKSNNMIEKTEHVGNDIMKLNEQFLRDVKVVLDRLEPEILYNIKVTDEMEPNELEVETVKQKTLEVEKVKPKKPEVETVKQKTLEVETVKPKKLEVETVKKKTYIVHEKISSRLIFEDELKEIDICDDDDEIIKDLTTECMDDTLFEDRWFNDLPNSITSNIDDTIVIDDSDSDKPQSDTEDASTQMGESNIDFPPSIHHDDLIKPGVYRCKRCSQIFPTKFTQIQHEMQHIRIQKPRPLLCEYCDRFQPTKFQLKLHITSKHSAEYRQRTYKKCNKCGLKYSNYNRHLENYHVLLQCHLCNKAFDTEVERLNHIRGHLIKIKCGQCDFVSTEIEIIEHQKLFHKTSVSISKTFNLCDMCCLFLRNKNSSKYVFGESISKIGERFDCEHCGNKFFHVTPVKRYGKGRERFNLEKDRKKVLTNTERLKNIQQRLKMINKLSRF